MEQFKGPAHPDNKPVARLELLAYPAQQSILAEFEDVVVRRRQGTMVALRDSREPEVPVWKRFVPERSVNDGFRIPFYERRISRAKRKAAKYATALIFEPKQV